MTALPRLRATLGYWPSAICLGIILYATLSPDPVGAQELPLIPHIDKIIHCIMMGGLTGAIAFDYYRADPAAHRLSRRAMLAIAAGVALFSIADELAQAFLTAARSADIFDLAADWAGCLIATVAAPPAIRAIVRPRSGRP